MKRRLEKLSHQPRDTAIQFVSSWYPIRNQNANFESGDGLGLGLYQPHHAAKPSQKINKYTKNRSQTGDTSRAPGKTKIKPFCRVIPTTPAVQDSHRERSHQAKWQAIQRKVYHKQEFSETTNRRNGIPRASDN